MKMPGHALRSSIVCILVLGVAGAVQADVVARYLRVEAPVSHRMRIQEIEIYSGGKNIVLHQQDGITGRGFRGVVEPDSRHHEREMFDGKKTGRGLTSDAAHGVGPWIEVDLGRMVNIDKVVTYQPTDLQYRDRGIRLVTLLDAGRRVVFAKQFDVRDAINKSGHATIEAAANHADRKFIGASIPKGAEHWVSLADVVNLERVPAPANAAQRMANFKHRNDPARIKALADKFIPLLDLSKPALKEVKAKYDAGDAQGALDAYRDYFFAHKIHDMTNELGIDYTGGKYSSQADDLMKGVAISFNGHGQVVGRHIEPGNINWAYVAPNEAQGRNDIAIDRGYANINVFQVALLEAYAKTGKTSYLDRWAAISDDWGMHFTSDAEASPYNIREYFVKEPVQFFYAFCYDLSSVARERPDFVKQMPSATLARLLLPVLREYLPAYWRQERHLVFNHTFNALTAAYRCSRILDDFYPGQRFSREVAQHLERTFTYSMTRDGSMIEVNDDAGHMTMPVVLGRILYSMEKNPPSWLTPPMKRRVENRYRDFYLLALRDMTPNGMDHRHSWRDMFGRVWGLTQVLPDFHFKGGASVNQYIPPDYLTTPDVRAIYDTVYGRGTAGQKLSKDRQAAKEKVVALFKGKYEGPPSFTSDFLPYAGLYYLRRNWEPDASFLYVTAQETGHYDANARMSNTMYRYCDFGYPLLYAWPVTIDGQEQYPQPSGYEPGSKTARLTASPRDPIQARWLSSKRYDVAEAFYEGRYQNVKSGRTKDWRQSKWRPTKPQAKGPAIDDVKTTRQFIQVRPYRVFIITDRVDLPKTKAAHRYSMDFSLFPETRGNRKNLKVLGKVASSAAQREVTLVNPKLPSLTARHFALEPVSYSDARAKARLGHNQIPVTPEGLAVSWKAKGDNALVTLLTPHRKAGDRTFTSVRQVSEGDVVGFDAVAADGGKVQYRTANAGRQALRIGDVRAYGEALLIVQTPKGRSGIALGIQRMSVHGTPAELVSSDFQFDLDGSHLSNAIPILRPIEPVRVEPQQSAFADTLQVSLKSSTPNVEIHYTTDGSEPTGASALYTGPFTIRESTQVMARAFRKGVDKVPFTVNGTEVSAISYGRFTKEPMQPAVQTGKLAHGLHYDYLEGTWFTLFSYADRMKPVKQGVCGKLMDVSARQTDGPFGMRYTGYLRVPTDGVYTFYAPSEYYKNLSVPGYDLRLWIDGKQWYLGQNWHGLGQWSIPLKAGDHKLMVTFADARAKDLEHQRSDTWAGFPTPWVVWRGKAPVIDVSGPNLSKRPIPSDWLYRDGS